MLTKGIGFLFHIWTSNPENNFSKDLSCVLVFTFGVREICIKIAHFFPVKHQFIKSNEITGVQLTLSHHITSIS